MPGAPIAPACSLLAGKSCFSIVIPEMPKANPGSHTITTCVLYDPGSRSAWPG
ncbi:MAG: hypothetical protein WAN43_04100 [Rhodomicrobium sp.]